MNEVIDIANTTPENMQNLRKTLAKGVFNYPKEIEPKREPQVYRRDLLHNYIYSKPFKELQEVIELENLYNLLKGTYDDLVYKRILTGRKMPTVQEIAYYKLLKETLVDLNKIKYGEKRTTITGHVNFSSIQEMMFGVPEEDKNV